MRPLIATMIIMIMMILPPAAPAAGETGTVDRVIDGDTIVMGDDTIRLWGIDAPEMDDTCTNGLALGEAARDRLSDILALSGPIACGLPPTLQDQDRWGRLVRLCRSVDLDMDIADAMVRFGYAVPCRRFAGDHYNDATKAAWRADGPAFWPECAELTLCEW